MRTLPFPSVIAIPFLLLAAACSGTPSVLPAVGGETSAGGAASEGGMPSWGGGTGVGGRTIGGTNAGGEPVTGGSGAIGGSATDGGAETGGSNASGGVAETGGVASGGTNTGGQAASGGTPVSGGSSATGGSAGGSSSATSSGACSSDSNCPASAHCASGTCMCWDTSAKICNGQCMGVLWDASNCGDCDHACPSTTPSCSNGQCVCFSPPCGAAGTGGAASSGGAPATGGAPSTGGAPATGGAATGGTRATGGAPATGGAATGGTRATGGAPGTGGAATGGTRATGGVPATGGAATGGTRATGGAPATGGSSSTAVNGSCTINNGLSSSNGELTCYYFGQGTSQGVCNGTSSYKTNCGYCGTESSSSGSACSTGHNDHVANISTGDYFVAVPNFSASSCGLCLSVSYGGKTVIATVVDNCATCGAAGHIDLSSAAGAALGLGTGTTENPKSGVTWKAVSCPVGTSSIVAGYNAAYSGQLYFQNVAFPVASASALVNGTTRNATLSTANAYWDFGTNLSPGTSLTLKDTQGHTITGTLQGNGQSIGAQFPTNCQ